MAKGIATVHELEVLRADRDDLARRCQAMEALLRDFSQFEWRLVKAATLLDDVSHSRVSIELETWHKWQGKIAALLAEPSVTP